MEDQIVSAVEIAWNPASDQNLKRQAVDYVNRLRTESSAWHPCLAIFTKVPRHSEVVRVFSLDVVNNAVQSGTVDTRGLGVVKEELIAYLRRLYCSSAGPGPQDGASVENKIAQTLTFLFSAFYANGWENFFADLLSLTRKTQQDSENNAAGVVFYLRVLNSIHDEIGDVLLSRSPIEQDRANVLKDLIRQRDVQKIALSWQEILSRWREGDNLVAELCLRAVGKWVSWIDISLVLNQRMLDLLFHQLARAQKTNVAEGEERVRDAAIDAFTEITGKKMKAKDKVELITFLNLDHVISQLIACPTLNDRRFSSQYDTDLAETVAKLVNTTVVEVIRVLDAEPQDSDIWQRAENVLQAFLPHLLRFFSDEYDEVCSTVIPSMNEVLSFLRKSAQSETSSPQRAVMLLPSLKAIFAKMRYDETSSWGEDDEQTDEAEFQDLRKRLNVLQQIIAAADEQLYMDTVTGLVGQTFQNLRSQGAQLDWRDLDLALHEMFLFGDLAIKSGGLYQKTKPNSPAAERLVQMMLSMVESDIRSFRHPATQLQYMEICVRYGSFFEKNTQYIGPVLQNFLQLSHHSIMKVKMRAWYLLQRYVRLLRLHIGDVAEDVIQNLKGLLTITAEIPIDAEVGDMSSEDLDSSSDANFNSQLYLFEAIGCICGSSSLPRDKQAAYAQSITSPLFDDMERSLPLAKASDERAILQIHHDVMALGTLVRGFSDWTPGSSTSSATRPLAANVQAAFAQMSEAILVALESLKGSFNIRTAARFALSRLIAVLGSQILPQLTRWIDGLLTQSASKDEMALFLRLLDQIIFGFKNDIYSILEALFTNLLQRVFSGLTDPTAGTDDEIQLAELKREYLNFLLVIMNNDLGSVIVSNRNQPFFETLIGTIEHFAKDGDDMPTAKMAFQVLGKMCSVWGGPDVVFTAGQANGIVSIAQPALPGLDRFMMARFSPLCWALPASPSFNAKDAQARQVLSEAAGLQKTIFSKTGQEYLSWLRDNELRNMGMNDEMIDEFLGKLSGLDMRAFKTFFPIFVGRGRNA